MTGSFRRRAAVLTAVLLLGFTPLVFGAADEHFKNGYNLFKEKKYAEAVAALMQSSEMSGNDYNFFLLLANAAMQAKQWDKVVQPAKKAASIEPAKKEPHVLLGSALLKREDYAGAADAFEKVVAITPNDFQMNYFAGYAHFKADHFEQAAAPLQKALTIKPGDYNALFTLGTAFAKLGRCQEAEKALKEAAAKQPKQAETVQEIIMACYSSSGDNEKAVELARKAVEKDPKDKDNLKFLAQSMMAAKKFDDALGYYQKLSALEPKEGDWLARIAQIRFLQKDYAAAIEFFEKALAVEKKCDWYTSLGSLYQTQGVDLDNEINETLQADPDAEPDQAKLDTMLAHYTKASAEYNKAIKACKSEDAKKGLASVRERVSAWKKYSEEAAKIEAGEDIEETEDEAPEGE